MPYASPSATTTTITATINESYDPVASRQTSRAGGHRRSRSVNDANLPPSPSSFVEPPAQHANTAAFSPLMGIPRRSRTTAFSTTIKPRGPLFALPADIEETQSSSGSGSSDTTQQQKWGRDGVTPSLALGLGLRVDTTNLPATETQPHSSDLEVPPAIPFPTLSASEPPPTDASSLGPSASINTATTMNAIPFPESSAKSAAVRMAQQQSSNDKSYTPTRSPSSPIIRKSNGSIVKPSLKSSLSSGNIPALISPSSPGASNNIGAPRNFTRSAPSTPSIKAVHFTEKDSVVLFEKSQRPVAVSLGSANGTPSIRPGSANGPNEPSTNGWLSSGGESETETERDTDTLGLFGPSSSFGYPFPSSTPGTSPSGSPAGSNPRIEIAKSKSSDVAAIPGTLSSAMLQASEARVHLESVTLATPNTSSPSVGSSKTNGDQVLKGTILVENVSFGKTAFVRFTLDEWQTTSEVGATYVGSLPTIRKSSSSSHHTRVASEPVFSGDRTSPPPMSSRKWDRFAFAINLSSVRHLHTRRLFLVVRYIPQEWQGAEFWDNNHGKNYAFVFQREKVNPRSGVSPSDEGVGSLGLVMGGGEKKSSMPVSPGFLKAKQQRLDMEAALEKVQVDRPVPKLPGPISIGKSASAPALGTNHHASRQHYSPDARQPHFPIHSSSPTSQQNRPRSHSAGSSYPAIQLKLSNYISPTTRNPSPPLPPSSPVITHPPASANHDNPRSGKQNRTGAPLSPPASPIIERLPTPPPSTDDDAPSTGDIPPAAQRQQQQVLPHAKIRMATPPESTQASPEATLIPLPASASPTSSDSDRDNLRMHSRKGAASHRLVNSPRSHRAFGNGNSPRAPAPAGLDFAGRFGNGNVDKRLQPPTTTQSRSSTPTGRWQQSKFTVGGSNESSSAETSPAHSTISPFNSPSIYDHPSSLSKTTGVGGSGAGLNNAPPEFLQKFCFFGSPEPSPTHTHSPSAFLTHRSAGPLMVGGEVLPSSIVGMGALSTLGGVVYHHPYAGLHMYDSGMSPALTADRHAAGVV